jgi:hypothetical protein
MPKLLNKSFARNLYNPCIAGTYPVGDDSPQIDKQAILLRILCYVALPARILSYRIIFPPYTHNARPHETLVEILAKSPSEFHAV